MTILLLESLHPDAEELLAGVGKLVRADDPNAPRCDFDTVEAILTRGRGRIGEALLRSCPRLRVIARAGVGLDNLDTQAAHRLGVPVVFAPGGNAETVAEHTMALVLDIVRGISRQSRAVAAGHWEERSRYAGNEIRGLTLGILGFGNIGQRVARFAHMFGMRVLVLAREGRPAPEPCTSVPLPVLLAESDVLTLHLPLTPATLGFLGAREIDAMKPGAFIVNTARGALIDGPSLRAALASGRLGGFAADVLEVEPPVGNDALLDCDRVVLTPHTASLTMLTYRAMCMSTATNVGAILRGEAPDPRSLHRG
ncbi:MAG: phosphoglycerate dehydrogenase [Planctomycetes bacterium]|nr:phosphoglycerate dehydrogenase [Planctomycetota bacterium]